MNASNKDALRSDVVLREYGEGRRDFTGCDIEDPKDGSPLEGAMLESADFGRCFIVANFRGCSLRGARFVGANVKTCCFDNSDLSGADFSGAAIDAATFVGADLRGASFGGSSCQGHILGDDELPEH